MPAPKKSVVGKIAKKVIKKVIKSDTPAKANARGLKAANAKLSKGNAKRNYDKDKIDMIDKANPNLAGSSQWASHPGYASQKSNDRLQKGKWSSEKQIARYQKKEIKDFRKPKKK
jgi:hypothetical protein